MYHEEYGKYLADNINDLADDFYDEFCGEPRPYPTAGECYDNDQDFVWYCKEAFENAIAGQQAKEESLTYDLSN